MDTASFPNEMGILLESRMGRFGALTAASLSRLGRAVPLHTAPHLSSPHHLRRTQAGSDSQSRIPGRAWCSRLKSGDSPSEPRGGPTNTAAGPPLGEKGAVFRRRKLSGGCEDTPVVPPAQPWTRWRLKRVDAELVNQGGYPQPLRQWEGFRNKEGGGFGCHQPRATMGFEKVVTSVLKCRGQSHTAKNGPSNMPVVPCGETKRQRRNNS